MTDTAKLLEVGNVLTGVTQSFIDASKNPAGVDKAALYMSTYATLAGVVGLFIPNSPFLVALSSGTAVNFGSLGVAANAYQLANAYNAYVSSMQTSDTAAQAAALTDLGDKVGAIVAAIGGTMAAVPIPAVQQVGLGIWLGATGAQQLLNGNAQRALDYLGSQFADDVANLIGGPHVTVGQYYVGNGEWGSGEIVTVGFVDQYGISRGTYSLSSGYADDVLTGGQERVLPVYTVTPATPLLPGLVIDLNNAPTIAQYTYGVSNSGFNSGLSYANSAVNSGTGGQGNTVDFAQSLINATGLSTNHLQNAVNPNSNSFWYLESLDHLFNNSWDTLTADEMTTGVYLQMHQYDFANTLGDSKRKQEIEILSVAWDAGAYTPLVVDLTGDGIVTTDIRKESVSFDIDGDGIVDRTAWINSSNGFLVVDENGNGTIDNVNEMFGGRERAAGYAKLKIYDSNEDGFVSSQDSAFNLLMLWQDNDTDGVTDAGELHSLANLKIDEIAVEYITPDISQHGNLIGEVSSVEVNGIRRDMADVYFRYASGDIFQAA